ncbi:hypothetical protein ACOTTU_04450 [Roseobacter sp. EG26]|uniref:hypothetical protein n=1 Tax=Roseobacter sp. EG26 TaxID=3412477 RepID=UPI003CE574CF
MNALNDRLLAAHAADDRQALIALYSEAAALAADIDAKGFYLTQAYVFALEAGASSALKLREQLVELNRETPD